MKLIRARFHAAVTMGVHNVPHQYVAVPYASDVNGVRIDNHPITIAFDYIGDVPGIVVRWGTDQTEFVPMTNVAGLMVTEYLTAEERYKQIECQALEEAVLNSQVVGSPTHLNAAESTFESWTAPKKRGRPKGAKNKPKAPQAE